MSESLKQKLKMNNISSSEGLGIPNLDFWV